MSIHRIHIKRFFGVVLILIVGLTICSCDLLDDSGSGPMQSADIRIVNDYSDPVVFWLGGSKTNSTATTKREIFVGSMNLRIIGEQPNLHTVINIGTEIGGNAKQNRVSVKIPDTINSGMTIKVTLVYGENGFRVASVT